MAKKLYALIFTFSLLGFFSCGTTNRNAESSLDWDEVYTGIVPGADSSINVKKKIKKDGTYSVSYQYIDKSDDVFMHTGTFIWKDKYTIERDNNEIPPYYLVGKETLTQLDMTGEKINGVHAENYVLKRK
jgi:uncharacterized lipoprotein NlpE involved in copper resistance